MIPIESTLTTSSYDKIPVNVAATPVIFLIVKSGVPERPVASPVTSPVTSPTTPPVAVIAPVNADVPLTVKLLPTVKFPPALVTFAALNALNATTSRTSPLTAFVVSPTVDPLVAVKS